MLLAATLTGLFLLELQHYDYQTNSDMMKTVLISKATAAQRTGRAGRVQNGACLRLYTKEMFDNNMPEYPSAEITRSPLEGMILTIMATGFTSFSDCKFVMKPGMYTHIY